MLASCYGIVGFGIGGSFTVDGNVFLEYCPPEKQYLLTGISVLSSLGAALPSAIALMYQALNVPYFCRFIQGTLGIIAFLLAIPRFWIEETPSYLISKLKSTNAYELIMRMDPESVNDTTLKERIISASPKVIATEKTIRQQLIVLFREPIRKYTILYLCI